ncbi:MAG: D-alanyl-D-alanine carboxypeptidase [Clostridia bacterium]|nr:D-alanyl-D-alanine carboxypeptidase [Clostridia bacterium]
MKKILSLILTAVLLLSVLCVPAGAAEFAQEVTAKSAILMDAATGKVLFEYNADEALPPASVTKVMTLLLVFEAIDSGTLKLTDMVTTSETAASMGGTQIFLEVGEQMCVEDLIKSVVISSANDAACALAEHIAGSESAFVAKMNERAKALGMVNTNFENTNGLDDTTENHVTSARDIAIMSRELMKHEKIFDYTTVWMDTVRGGEFGLSNTNRLLRTYSGCTGLKTGSTSKAKFCISATAKRGDLSLIAVVMGAPTRDERNALAAKLLDFGFANYALFSEKEAEMEEIKLTGGTKNTLKLKKEGYSALLEKTDIAKIEAVCALPESVPAPVKKGDVIGTVTYKCGETVIGKANIVANEDAAKMDFFTMMWRILRAMLCASESE